MRRRSFNCRCSQDSRYASLEKSSKNCSFHISNFSKDWIPLWLLSLKFSEKVENAIIMKGLAFWYLSCSSANSLCTILFFRGLIKENIHQQTFNKTLNVQYLSFRVLIIENIHQQIFSKMLIAMSVEELISTSSL